MEKPHAMGTYGRGFLATVISLLTAFALLPSSATSAVPDLPNLVPLPRTIELGEADTGTGLSAIRLDTVVANRGTAHLDLMGVPDQGSVQKATAYQCIAWTADRVCGERQAVGDFEWHPSHGHHHFVGFGKYELRRLNRKQRPDLRKKGLVAGGTKISFCLIDYEEDGEETFLPGTGLSGWPGYSTCLVGSGSQGISRGWRDVYTKGLTGQQVVVDDVEPGTYALVIRVDPDDRLFETDETDNTLAFKLHLGDGGLTELCLYSSDLRSCEQRASEE